ncbi:MAG: bifunctional UDP-sugar hydrolase/5'-nucleotidase [Kofleriaceae bacterium]
MKVLLVVVSLAIACSSSARHHGSDRPAVPRTRGTITLSIVGTNDLHGALERLPLLAGYIHNLRDTRETEGGGVVLIDAGDMFQGTLESNLSEGEHVVRAYNQIGYSAVALGNHEFDYGPAGPAPIAASAEDDPRGALKARAQQATFPMLTSNIDDEATGRRIKWPNMPASILIEVAGINVGIIGATTEATPHTTMPANFVGLQMAPAATRIVDEAKALRAKGAQVIVVTAHIGSSCKSFDDPNDLTSCNHEDELFKLIGDLPRGIVDVIIAGHTHAGIAHRINDIAVIESFSSGRAFGRIDLRISPNGHVSGVNIHKPQSICEGEKEGNPIPIAACTPSAYEHKPVVADPEVQAIVDDALRRAGTRRGEKLGVTLVDTVPKAYGSESAVGNLFTDLMRTARPEAHVAVTNGGGLRADLPAGELTYGQLFEAMPFDNRFALVDVTGADLRKLVSSNLQRGGGILSWSGLSAKARCKGGKLEVAIKIGGKPLVESARYKLVTSDFLASGGDGLIGRMKLPEGSIKLTGTVIRDAIADVLRKTKGSIDPAKLYSPATKRLDYEGKRPVECAAAKPAGNQETPE